MKKNNKSEYYTGGETKMISESYIKDLLLSMGYIKKNHIYEKFFPSFDCYIKVDLKNRTIIYPEDRGMTISNRTTCNFSAPENFVVLECVTRLFDKGYRPKHLNLEKEWTLGHESKGGRADICVSDQEGNTLFIVECKTYGREYEKEYKNIVNDVGQLFSYWQQERSCKFLVLYALESSLKITSPENRFSYVSSHTEYNSETVCAFLNNLIESSFWDKATIFASSEQSILSVSHFICLPSYFDA